MIFPTISSFDSSAEDFGFSAIGWERDGGVKKRNTKGAGVLRRLCGEAETAVVEGGMAVVKKSEEPYEDFKRSMLDMILLKQMYRADELERLLQCFLSLNSPEYHTTIVDVFTEIWELLFCENSKNY